MEILLGRGVESVQEWQNMNIHFAVPELPLLYAAPMARRCELREIRVGKVRP